MRRGAILLSIVLCAASPALAGWEWLNPTPQGNHLFGAHGGGPGNLYAVGARGTIQSWDGMDWTIHESGVDVHLWGVWAWEPGAALAVGELVDASMEEGRGGRFCQRICRSSNRRARKACCRVKTQ